MQMLTADGIVHVIVSNRGMEFMRTELQHVKFSDYVKGEASKGRCLLTKESAHQLGLTPGVEMVKCEFKRALCQMGEVLAATGTKDVRVTCCECEKRGF